MAQIGQLRVAFAGLAHSHPFADAANLLAFGGEVVGAFDTATADEFTARFGGARVDSLEGVVSLHPDAVIATPITEHAAVTFNALCAAGLDVPIFFNKVVAANPRQLADWNLAVATASAPVGTCSVLRFAPSLADFAATVASEELIALRVQVKQDAEAYRTSGRQWQDDPSRGGGSLITIGIHAWEIVDVVVPGAVLTGGAGWTWTAEGSITRSEDYGRVWGTLLVDAREISVHVVVDGRPGPAAYSLEAVTREGVHRLVMGDGDINETLGFAGLIRGLMVATAAGAAPAPWKQARIVVQNTIRAAEVARGS